MLKLNDHDKAQHPGPPFDAGLAFQAVRPLFTGMADANAKAWASCLEINRQWTAFLMRRFREDAALVHQLAKCTGSLDALQLYSQFLQKVFADYQQEFGEIMTVGRPSVEETQRCAPKGAQEPLPGENEPSSVVATGERSGGTLSVEPQIGVRGVTRAAAALSSWENV